jgi:hypothetical protein
VIDPDKPRTVEVNKDLVRVYVGMHLAGQVRRGMDGMWYPELGEERTKGAAVQAVLIADEAISEYMENVHGGW